MGAIVYTSFLMVYLPPNEVYYLFCSIIRNET
jgi:hypothetical protein